MIFLSVSTLEVANSPASFTLMFFLIPPEHVSLDLLKLTSFLGSCVVVILVVVISCVSFIQSRVDVAI